MSDPEPPPHSAELLVALRRLAAAADQIDARAADGLGIGRNDLRCLDLLANGPLAARIIAERLGLTSGSVTALLDRLERRGLVRRLPDPQDRRGVLVEATAQGHGDLVAIRRSLAQATARLAERYGAERAEAAARYLGDMARICEWAAAHTGRDPSGASD